MDTITDTLFLPFQFIVRYLASWKKRYESYLEAITTPGELVQDIPVVTLLIRGIIALILCAWISIQVGNVQVVNPEYRDLKGKVIFIGNHSSYFDALIIARVLNRRVRYMTALNQFGLTGDAISGFFGLRAILMSSFGAFPVDTSQRNGKSVVGPCVDFVIAGGDLLLYPSGKISLDGGIPEEFKVGAFVIAQRANAQLPIDDQVQLVPFHYCYGNRDVPSAHGPYHEMGLKWRNGCTVTFGPPIQAPGDSDPEKVMQEFRAWLVSVPCSTTYDTASTSFNA